ncbi:unnamed protein product [Nesidiocoris tenuis]|uniref:Uncharacterized protein n=1 Tax=Nesidiocoris tenuis TaxID=355587 RepID=A0A6H5HIV8_9HEMI|nr:unnamed protein product [Nesidiocoris tenuis]
MKISGIQETQLSLSQDFPRARTVSQQSDSVWPTLQWTQFQTYLKHVSETYLRITTSFLNIHQSDVRTFLLVLPWPSPKVQIRFPNHSTSCGTIYLVLLLQTVPVSTAFKSHHKDYKSIHVLRPDLGFIRWMTHPPTWPTFSRLVNRAIHTEIPKYLFGRISSKILISLDTHVEKDHADGVSLVGNKLPKLVRKPLNGNALKLCSGASIAEADRFIRSREAQKVAHVGPRGTTKDPRGPSVQPQVGIRFLARASRLIFDALQTSGPRPTRNQERHHNETDDEGIVGDSGDCDDESQPHGSSLSVVLQIHYRFRSKANESLGPRFRTDIIHIVLHFSKHAGSTADNSSKVPVMRSLRPVKIDTKTLYVQSTWAAGKRRKPTRTIEPSVGRSWPKPSNFTRFCKKSARGKSGNISTRRITLTNSG